MIFFNEYKHGTSLGKNKGRNNGHKQISVILHVSMALKPLDKMKYTNTHQLRLVDLKTRLSATFKHSVFASCDFRSTVHYLWNTLPN